MRDISSHFWGSVRISSRALAICLELVGSTSRPWCSVAMMSTGPPFLVATVGTPCAAACSGAGHNACASVRAICIPMVKGINLEFLCA